MQTKIPREQLLQENRVKRKILMKKELNTGVKEPGHQGVYGKIPNKC